MSKPNILLLGGTTEAREIAEMLAQCPNMNATLSLAGATTVPGRYALPTRVGGFGGIEGLRSYLIDKRINLLVNATHPYADRMWVNAITAAEQAGVPLVVFHRPEWTPVEGDCWSYSNNVDAAVKKLRRMRVRKVFLPLGRKELAKFEAAPKHRYLIRAIEAFETPLKLPNATYLKARPPFTKAAEIALMRKHEIDLMIIKNSGGSATYAKIAAARELGIETIVIRRPHEADVPHCRTVAQTMSSIAEQLGHVKKRVA